MKKPLLVIRRILRRRPGRSRPPKGAALIMTLVILVLLSILITGFVVSMRTEMAASYSSENIQRTKMIAQGALSHAIDLLRSNIPDPARLNEYPGPVDMQIEYNRQRSTDSSFDFRRETGPVAPAQNWVVNPGRLTIINEDNQAKFIDLHTGATTGGSSSGIRDADSVDLNEPFPGETTPAIVMGVDGEGFPDPNAEAPKMRVKWVNVYEDPSEAPSAENPMVGRYAFWIDDECAKINFNTAIGKPAPGEQPEFDKQLHGDSSRLPLLTPVYKRGDAQVERLMNYTGTNLKLDNTIWALGHPGSVNLDLLFDYGSYSKDDLLDNKLIVNMWKRGYSRYPEAILDYLDMDSDADKKQWLRENRFNLTHYSRAPEFNVFGFSRFFTTNVPLSLESGPLYQLPFTVGEGDDHIFHLHSLMGTFGFTDNLTVSLGDDGAEELDDKVTILAGNVVNRAQIDLIMRYLSRQWPGYAKSSSRRDIYRGTFMGKYGYAGCLQLATSIIRMARVATTTMNEENVDAFNRAWSYRNTSTNFSPPSGLDREKRPERYYWRFDKLSSKDNKFLPQMGGPHIMEVHLNFKPPEWIGENADKSKDRYRIPFSYEVEYYMHPYGPIVGEVGARRNISGEPPQLGFAFPTQVDLLELTVKGASGTVTPEEHIQRFSHPAWDQLDRRVGANGRAIRMGLLRAEVNPRQQWLGPAGASFDTNDPLLKFVSQTVPPPMGGITNRIMVESDTFYIGTLDHWPIAVELGEVPPTDGPNPVMIFETKKGIPVDATITFNFRLGMSVQQARVRPKQMIPRTDSNQPSDNLYGEAKITFSRLVPKGDKFVWECLDPRISNRRSDWILNPNKTGSPPTKNQTDASHPSFDPDDGRNIGLGGDPNLNEPSEFSSEKSKFLTLQRALAGSQVYSNKLQRGDEYTTDSRFVSPGYWSLLHTGMVDAPLVRSASDKGPEYYRTMDLGPDQNDPPDWLLLDLFGATFPAQRDQWRKEGAGPDEFSSISFMNSTMGKINLNTKIFPDNAEFNVPDRRKPIEAVFKHLRDDSKIKQVVDGIIAYQDENEWFDYIGELSEVNGYDNVAGLPHQTQFEREALLRNMAGCLTTKSNTFGVWGVAQTVKKSARNDDFDELENGDQILGEKRFFAIIERYVWPGKDGVPGNAHVDGSGKWDKIAKDRLPDSTVAVTANTLFHLPGSPPLNGRQVLGEYRLNLDKPDRNGNGGGVYPILDGPEKVGMDVWPSKALGKVEYEPSSLEDAYNPPQPVMKYRIAYFKYLDN